MSDGGLIVPPPGFLKALQDRCRKHGIRVVVDEVKVGLGRTGKTHCFEHEGLEPDVVVFGKALGGGLPLSAVVGPKEIMDHAPAFACNHRRQSCRHGRGTRRITALQEEGLAANAGACRQCFVQGLRALGKDHSIIGNVRGRGLAVGVELIDGNTGEPRAGRDHCEDHLSRVSARRCIRLRGLARQRARIHLPLTLTEPEVGEALGIIDQALRDVVAGRVSDADVAPFMMW